MKNMRKPEMDVIRFSCSDIVAASTRTVSWSGLEDTVNGNNNITFNGKTYTISTSTAGRNMRTDLAAYFNDPSLAEDQGNDKVYFGSTPLSKIVNSGTSRPGMDGIYVYDGNKKFSKKQ